MKFQKVTKENHVEYHLPINPNLYFFDEITDNYMAWKESIMYLFGFTDYDSCDYGGGCGE